MAGRVRNRLRRKPIYNAKNPLILSVGEKEIRCARRKDPASCAIARCIIRNKIVDGVRVGTKIALVEYSSHFERYVVPKETKQELESFDNNGTFKKGKYKLLPPPPSLKKPQNHRKSRSGKSGIGVRYRPSTREFYRTKEV